MEKFINVKELRDTNAEMKALFWEIIGSMKAPQKLNDMEICALIKRVGYLSDDERAYYNSVLIRDNMPPDEIERYTKLQLINKYFSV